MSNAKKVLSVLLAIVMIACTSVIAFAAVIYEDVTTNTQTWVLSDATQVDSTTYTATVSLTTNYPTGPIQFRLDGLTSDVTLTAVTLGAAYPAAYSGEVNFSTSTGKVMIIPGVTDSTTAVAINGVIANLTFTVANSGSATITIENLPKTEHEPAGTLIAARMHNGDLTGNMIPGQAATVSGTANIGSLPPELVAASGYTANIIIDTTKTCGNAYTGAVYGFTGNNFRATTYEAQLDVTNSGTMTVDTTNGTGTGAVIKVFAAGNTTTPVATYIVIVFGDIDGNGRIAGADTTELAKHFAGTATLTRGTPKFMAADVNSPYNRMSSADTTRMSANFSGSALNQHDVGALHNTAYSN